MAKKDSFAPEPAAPPLVEASPDAVDWDATADVVVIGFGGAGACAALEASAAGASVCVLDRFHGGGATAISGGVVYTGGGSHIQKEAGVEDDVENMYRYLSLEVKGVVSDETLRDFCDHSISNLEWLEGHGIPFEGSLCPVKTSYPTDDYFLYYSGNEGFPPYSDSAKPAPRGHRAKGSGLPGANFYEPLRKAVHNTGADVQYAARVTRLVTDTGGRVIGAEYEQIKKGWWRNLHRRLNAMGTVLVKYNPKLAAMIRRKAMQIEAKHTTLRRVRANNAVVLSAGGFIYNRQMIKEHAPAYRPGMPLGTLGDNGSGILLGQSVGGATDLMERVSAWRFVNPPQAFAEGMMINKKGERYINEFMYGAAVGEAMVEHNEGVAILVIDEELRKQAREQCKRGRAQWFQRAPALLNLFFNSKKASTLEGLAKQIKVPPEALQQTVNNYNDAADGLKPDPFGKTTDRMQAIRNAPFYAINCSINSKLFPCPTLTLGGLVVDEKSGQVKRDDGSFVDGLYAAGRNAIGVCSRQYVSGLSIADCVYSGRRAGRCAATLPTTVTAQPSVTTNGQAEPTGTDATATRRNV